MNNHPYLRAYMAGIAVPTPLLLVALTLFSIARFVYNVPIPVERVIIFPMAIVPNLFGVWNVLHVASGVAPAAGDSRRDPSLHPRADGILPRACPGVPEDDGLWVQLLRCRASALRTPGAGVSGSADRLLPGLEIPDRVLQSSGRNRGVAKSRME